MSRIASRPGAEERNEKVRAVLRESTHPMSPTQIAKAIAEEWCCYDGKSSGACSAPISAVLKRIGAVRIAAAGKWALPVDLSALIQPVEVVRDEFGFWTHPDLPSFDEGDGEKYHAWRIEQGIRTSLSLLEHEPDDHPAYVSYFEDSCLDISSWNPAPPAGEGWFLLAIHDTEDGPVFCWATRAPGGAA